MRPLRALIPYGVGPLFLSELVLLTSCFVASAWALEQEPVATYFFETNGTPPLLITLATIFVSMYLMGLYSTTRVRSRIELLQQLSQAVGLALILQSLLGYIRSDLILSRWVMLAGCGIALLVLFAWRLIYSNFVLRAVGDERLLIVGASPASLELTRSVDQGEIGYKITAFLGTGHEADPGFAEPVSRLRDAVKELRPTRIVVGMTERRGQMPVQELFDLRFAGRRVDEARLVFEEVFHRVCWQELQPGRVVFNRELEPRGGQGALGRIIGTGVAAILVLLLSPALLLLSLVLALANRGRIVSSELRVGRHGKIFRRYRFRTQASWLARLAELFNVLNGDMAFIGPRPERPEFARELSERIPFYEYRQRVRPGIIGWAQIHAPRDGVRDSLRDLEYDLYYIKHLSLSLNAFIVLHTFQQNLSFAGGN